MVRRNCVDLAVAHSLLQRLHVRGVAQRRRALEVGGTVWYIVRCPGEVVRGGLEGDWQPISPCLHSQVHCMSNNKVAMKMAQASNTRTLSAVPMEATAGVQAWELAIKSLTQGKASLRVSTTDHKY